MYVGGKSERSEVLRDFKMGRLDVREYSRSIVHRALTGWTSAYSRHVVRDCTKRHRLTR